MEKLVCLRNRSELQAPACDFFSGCFGVPRKAYEDSMQGMRSGGIPQWYLCLEDGEIAGGLGVIENDFHERKDLSPNVCAVFVKEPFRRRGIAGRLLSLACRDMHELGIDTLYLLTDHTGFYERYGWKFLTMVQGTDPWLSRMYIHTFTEIETEN